MRRPRPRRPLAPHLAALGVGALLFASAGARAAPDASGLPVYRLEEIVVTGSRTERARSDATAPVERIDRAQIEAAGAENVAEILATHPGVEVEPSFRGHAVRLQGLDPKYVLVLVDGERAQGRIGGALDLSRFPTDAVERIEIVKGAGSALHGADAVAGVINIITRRPQRELELGGHLSGGMLGALDASARLGTRRAAFDAILTAGHHRSAGWDLSPATPATTSSAFRTSDVSLAAGWRPRPGFRLGGRAEYLRRHGSGVDAGGTGALFDRQSLTEQASATLEPDWRWDGGSRLRLVAHQGVYVDQYVLDQRGSGALDEVQRTRELQSRASAQQDVALAAGHLLSAGAELMHERIRSPRLAEGSGARTRAGLFVQHEWIAVERPRLTLLPGARLDGDSQFGWHPSPKIALRLDPSAALVLRGGLGLGYRAPSFQELYLVFENPGAGYRVDGNPALAPERSRSVNLDAEWRPVARLGLSLGLFRSDIHDLIVTRLRVAAAPGVPSGYGYANVASAHTQGLEAGLTTSLLAGLDLHLSYTLSLARDDASDRPLEGRPRHRGTFRAGYRFSRWGTSASARGAIVGARPFYSADDGVETSVFADPHATLGVRLAQRIWAGREAVEIFVGGDNLLGAGDERFLPLAPRTFYGGIDLRR